MIEIASSVTSCITYFQVNRTKVKDVDAGQQIFRVGSAGIIKPTNDLTREKEQWGFLEWNCPGERGSQAVKMVIITFSSGKWIKPEVMWANSPS